MVIHHTVPTHQRTWILSHGYGTCYQMSGKLAYIIDIKWCLDAF